MPETKPYRIGTILLKQSIYVFWRAILFENDTVIFELIGI